MKVTDSRIITGLKWDKQNQQNNPQTIRRSKSVFRVLF